MPFTNPFYIAWHMLTHNRGRFVLSSLGVAFAVVIMFMEMGFFNGINDSQANLAGVLDADLIIESKRKRHLKQERHRLTIKRLSQARALDEVVAATPIYTESAYWRNPQDGSRSVVLVIAISLDHPGLSIAAIEHYRSQLRLPDTVLYDRWSRNELGDIQLGTRAQLRHTVVTVVGFFDLGANFSYEGHVIVSHENFYRLFSDRGTERVVDQISLGALKLRPEADPGDVKAKLLQQLPGDFAIMTKAQMAQREKAHTIRKSPVGIIFGIGLVVGFIIGVIICYQILFNEIQDHLAQFATLKAIGHHQMYVFGIVVSEALLLSVVGFLLGLLLSWGLYQMIEQFTQIIMSLTLARGALIFALTASMCLFSAMLAAYKVIRADPAELY